MKNLIIAIASSIVFFLLIFLISYLISITNKEWYFTPIVISGVLLVFGSLIFSVVRWLIYIDEF